MESLSVVLPAYNEEENVEQAVRHVSEVAETLGRDYEIVLVNDGSAGSTAPGRSAVSCRMTCPTSAWWSITPIEATVEP